MRYYAISITNDDGTLIKPSWAQTLNWPATYISGAGSNFNGGVSFQTYQGALRLEVDIIARNFNAPRGGSLIRVHGVSVAELSQSFDLAGKNIQIDLGMAPGLPLSKPRTNYTALNARIFQCFGNMQGTDRYLEMTFVPPSLSPTGSKIISFNWQANTTMESALATTLQQSFPDYKPIIRISDQLKMASPQPSGPINNLTELNQVVFDLSQDAQFTGIQTLDGTTPYPGVHITLRGKTILVYDGTKEYGAATLANPTKIDFEDLIGQPTWITSNTINFKCVMRADIQVGDYIKLPPTLATPYVLTTQGSAPFPNQNTPARNNLSFLGTFKVIEVHYFGDSRQPSGDAWSTTYDAVFTGGGLSTSTSGAASP